MHKSGESRGKKIWGIPLVLTLLTAPVASTPAFADAQEPGTEDRPADVVAEEEDLDYLAPESEVLISEVANGGPGGHIDNFIEITNYGEQPQDISGWYIYRCGQSGDSYGPQDTIPEGTVLESGEQYTTVREGSSYDGEDFADSTYDVSLHSFGVGALLRDADHQPVDRIAFYHEYMENSECRNPHTLQNQVSWAHGQSHQRVGRSGDITEDWIVAESTPGAENNTEWHDITADRSEVGDILITEFAPGGPEGYQDDFIELANAGDEPVDIGDWQVWRCGNNSQTYVQSGGLPEGTVIDPGETYVLAREGSETQADLHYETSVHWINSGAMVLTPEAEVVDRMSIYSDRVSPCTEGQSKAMDLEVIQGESYQRISDTGDNATDFVAAYRTPGSWPGEEELESVERADSEQGGAVEITELIASGPAGEADEFVELTNLSDAPVDMAGWRLHRCEGTGRVAGSPQIDDLEVTLEPGQTYLAAHEGAPEDLLSLADATYETGLNSEDGYGAVLYDGVGGRVDGVGVYDTVAKQHCGNGLTLQNNTRSDEGISYQRARSTGVSYDDFIKAERTPGEYVEHEWRDEASPRPGQTDAVEVERSYRPGTPLVESDGAELNEDAEFTTAVRTEHGSSSEVDVSFRSASPVSLDEESTHIFSGTTDQVPPDTLEIDGEEPLADDDQLVSQGSTGDYPFQRYQVRVEEIPEEGLELVWTGQTQDRNEMQAYGWDYESEEWLLLDSSVPSEEGDISLTARVPDGMLDGMETNLLVMDGPRTQGGLLEDVGVTDESFADPGSYDFSLNHMTDTQFYSEGFVSVFMDMAAWVIANQDARNIEYSVNTGDIIQNWMRGYEDPERAHREFRDAQQIIDYLNEHEVANGVLPGNHDNWWGRNNDLYNEYFGPDMFEDQPWWGNSWQPEDNSAHYDFFTHDGVKFLILNLQYNPSDAQMQWASDVAEANPEWNVVLATHSYLYTDGEHEDIDRRHSARGRELWEEVVAPNDNIFLVLGGHYHGVATNYADPVTGEQTDAVEMGDSVVVDNVGAEGRRVVEMLADYQGYRSSQPEPREDLHDRDTGFQRLLQFDLDAGLMGVNTYSSTLDAFDAWRYDEPDFRGENARYGPEDDEFVVQVSLNRPTSFSTQAWTVQGTSSEEAVVTVPSGEVAEHRWQADDAGLSWYAVVSAAGVVDETSADEAAERAAEGSLLEYSLEEQTVDEAGSDPYPEGDVESPGTQEDTEAPDAEESLEPGAMSTTDVVLPGARDTPVEAAEEDAEVEAAEEETAEDGHEQTPSDEQSPPEGPAADDEANSEDEALPEDEAVDQDGDGASEEEVLPEDEAVERDGDGASDGEANSGDAVDRDGGEGPDEVIADEEAPEEDSEDVPVRELNEPEDITGPSVVTFPRELGESTDPGEPGDPGLPEEPSQPEDPGQPDVPEDDTAPELPVPPEDEELPAPDPEDGASGPEEEGERPAVPDVEDSPDTEGSGSDDSGPEESGSDVSGKEGRDGDRSSGAASESSSVGDPSTGWLPETGAGRALLIGGAALGMLLLGSLSVAVARRRGAGRGSV